MFQVWITLEEWKDKDSKLRDVETFLVGEVTNEDSGRKVFRATMDMSVAMLDHLDPAIKFIQ